jgi:H/ACA ribonucleoprotein complex subunit 4
MDKLPFEKIKREILVKKEFETDWSYGQDPNKRKTEELINYGIINLNKLSGPTSHMVSDYVQKILGINKSGHSGTLDPGVTGVLPIALGKATRIVQTLLNAGKEYVCLMYIHKPVDEKEIDKAVEKFTGKIKQLPPIKSAIKRRLRTREIYYFNILEIHNQEVLFKVGCEAGTYIRKLVYDIGQELKTGAHMVQLIRTKAGPFSDSSWHSLHDLKDAYEFYREGDEKELRNIILPIEEAVKHLPKIWVVDSAVDSICHGASLSIPGISRLNDFSENETVAIMTLKYELVALGNSTLNSDEVIKKDKGLAVKTTKVFMDRNIYPKFTSKK